MRAVNADFLKLLEVIHQFEVPIYQRAYAWGEAECEQLWKDILRAGSSEKLKSHFTGSVVYVKKAPGTETSAQPDLIIDGQQRVTTLTLILKALERRLSELPSDEQEPVDGFAPNKIRGRYLLNTDEGDERRFRLLLSQDDREVLQAIVQGIEPPADSASRVIENYRRFEERMTDPDLDLAALCRGMSKLTVVDISLEIGIDHPQLVFEAMNSTGKKLSQTDLIRNFVLMDLPPKEQQAIYSGYWRPMERDFGQQAYETQFDQFMRHYLTIKTGSIPRLDGIYEAFKDFVDNRTDDGIESLVAELRQYARWYCAIALGKETDPALRRAFRDLDQIKADVVYPFLLEVYAEYTAGTIEAKDVLEIVRMVTSYIFRRAVVRVPTNSLNKTFATFGRALRKDRYVESVKANFLRMQGYQRFPADDEFERELKQSDLYNFKRRSYFLRLMENYGRKEPVSIDEYTIEHIMPQNDKLRPEWREALGPDWAEVHRKYLHTLGNLTLTGYNSEYSDRPFITKRDMEGGFRESPLRLNHELGQLDTWNAQTITARAERLAREALRIWTRPELDADILAQYQPAPSTEVAAYSIDDHPSLLPPVRRALFERFSREVLAFDPSVTREFRKLYVAFKAETNFVDVIPQIARMRLSLNIPFEALHDERGLAVDVTNKGRWGNGPTEVELKEESDFAYVMGLVRQAFEYQIGGD